MELVKKFYLNKIRKVDISKMENWKIEFNRKVFKCVINRRFLLCNN